MAGFLVELYVSGSEATAVALNAGRARAAAEAQTQRGRPVRYVRSIFVPEDETCLLLYEAHSVDAVRAAVSAAAIRFERVVEAVET